MKPPIQLSQAFRDALQALEEGRHLFITGRAGTGKSTLLELFRNTTNKKVAVVAPTGIAALNVGGQTIHSFFGFPPRMIMRRDIRKKRGRKLYKNLEVLVIDEISMVRADMLDAIDQFLRLNRNSPLPFGGVQLALFGDLFQLPPILASEEEKYLISERYDSPYFFSAEVIQNGFPLEMWELHQVYRQENRQFLRLLEEIRLDQIDRDTLESLNARYLPDFEAEDGYITLTARNATAQAINQKALGAIPLPARIYQAEVKGDFQSRLYPTQPALALKLNAQVMCLKNDPEGAFVNGTIGKVVKLEAERVTLLVDSDGKKRYIEVAPMEWDILRYKANPEQPDGITAESVGSFVQMPLKLAWAVTIHKAQGMTFDRVIIDLGRGAFEHGQTYVALSRCRTLGGIVLKQPLRSRDVRTDPAIVDFYMNRR